MKFRVFIVIITSLLLISPPSNAQYLDSLKNILSSKVSKRIKETEGGKFIVEHQKKMIPDDLANCYQEFGKWFYLEGKKSNNRKNLKRAIFYTEKALSIKQDNNVSLSSLKATLYNLGSFYYKNRNYFKAIECYERIKEVAEVDSNTLSALRMLSKIYLEIGDFYKALTNVNSLISWSSKETSLRKKTMQAYQQRAIVYSYMDRRKFSEEIRNDVHKADSILSLLPKKKAKYYSSLNQLEGNRLLENGYYKEAIPYFEKVLEKIPKYDSINLARGYNSLGQSYSKLKDYKKAFLYFDKSLLYNLLYSIPYENRGDIFIAKKQFELGLQEYQKAINLLVQENLELYEAIPQKKLEEVRDKYFLLSHIIRKAKGLLAYYQIDKKITHIENALIAFKTADRLIDIIRFESTEVQSKLFWREKGADLYVGAVEACYLLNKPEEAFYFMEKNKAILLLEDITNNQAIENSKLPVYLANKEFQLKNNINTIENKLQGISKKELEKVEEIKRALYLSKRTYASFIDSLMVAYPDYRKYKKELPIISYKEAKEISKIQNKLFLQYITTDTKGYGILIGSSKPMFFEIEKANELPEQLSKFEKLVTQKITTNNQQAEFQQVANELFNMLIPAEVYNEIKNKELIIIPDYRLQTISFETLVTSKEVDSYLLKDVILSYAYSLSYLKNNNQIKRTSEKGMLSIAPIDFKNLKLPSLAYTLSEANATNNIFNGAILVKEKATKKNFLNTGKEFKGLHLATHAEVANTEQSWIAFNDAKLSLQEIYGYKNAHEIVTLSACKTSLGALQLGEGVMSLARGFFYGGAKSVVSSLWASNDKANEVIIIDFYKELKNGVSKSKALRNAKLNYLKNHQGIEASPFYWGSYIVIGDVSSVDLYTSSLKNIYIIGFFIFLVFMVLLFFFKRTR
ncbi:CHAT domain-containing protein [Tenacibaculum amylolyticum]|uniref:CHAT domain-containing protein n=1 Tax=Tenacibaculum amylolyticum TaxID=104269 RepID=UPI0038962011